MAADVGVEALVVGAGPVGLTLATELARAGVSHRLVDKAPEPNPLSRAAGIHSRTLELLALSGAVVSGNDGESRSPSSSWA